MSGKTEESGDRAQGQAMQTGTAQGDGSGKPAPPAGDPDPKAGAGQADDGQPDAPTPPLGGSYVVQPSGKLKRTDDSPEARQAIIDAIGQLDPDNSQAWTSGGKPDVAALELVLGYDIDAADRDAAWAEFQAREKGEA